MVSGKYISVSRFLIHPWQPVYATASEIYQTWLSNKQASMTIVAQSGSGTTIAEHSSGVGVETSVNVDLMESPSSASSWPQPLPSPARHASASDGCAPCRNHVGFHDQRPDTVKKVDFDLTDDTSEQESPCMYCVVCLYNCVSIVCNL
jgi:hypothetical protein